MNLGEKFLEKAVDASLVAVFYNFEVLTHKRKDWGKLGGLIENSLENFNYETIRRSISYLKKLGLIQAVRERRTLPQVTEAGHKRLNSILPHYDEKRIWDQRIYLITYDLPIEKNKERDILRDFLKKIGCGMLQKSVWLTPYNPTKLVKDFVDERNLLDLILVSSIGKDGNIGQKDISEILIDVYKLPKLNEEYGQFISDLKNNKLPKDQLIFSFLNILNRDPQLPFRLLPTWWVGNKAYQYFRKIPAS